MYNYETYLFKRNESQKKPSEIINFEIVDSPGKYAICEAKFGYIEM